VHGLSVIVMKDCAMKNEQYELWRAAKWFAADETLSTGEQVIRSDPEQGKRYKVTMFSRDGKALVRLHIDAGDKGKAELYSNASHQKNGVGVIDRLRDALLSRINSMQPANWTVEVGVVKPEGNVADSLCVPFRWGKDGKTLASAILLATIVRRAMFDIA